MYIVPAPQPPSPPPLLAAWPPFPGGVFGNNGTNNGTGGGDGEPGGELPSNWSSLIGIVTAIVGNVLIALALNVQRYAHIQLHQQRQRNRERARQALKNASGGAGRNGSSGGSGGYGTSHGSSGSDRNTRRYHDEEDPNVYDEDEDDDDMDYAREDDPLTGRANSNRTPSPTPSTSTSYLRSPSWWLGQVLITVGEMGNFLAYGFAPASIVSPLGVVGLISNCVIAPILFKERFRLQDFWGVVVAIGGAVTVVLSAKQEETKLAPHDIWDAITTPAFEIYVGVTCGLIALLMWASPRYGNRTILIDLGLVGLFGGYTVLATKGVSSMLSSTLFRAFITPMTYVLIFILLATAVMQVRYVNKALQRFDSTQVIPIQFVMFTLSVILGSAVLYRDFERTTAEQAAKFIGGCLLTFFGVFIITSGRPRAESGDDQEDEEEDFETNRQGETIGLAEQQTQPRPSVPPSPSSPGSSRRSSRASFASRSGGGHLRPQPLRRPTTDSGVPTPRNPVTIVTSPTAESHDVGSDGALLAGEEAAPPSWVADNPWRDPSASPSEAPTPAAVTARPPLGVPTVSADSALHTIGAASVDRPHVPHMPHTTPHAPHTLHTPHFQSPIFSPSPLLSSTVSTTVADTILKHMDVGGGGGSGMGSSRVLGPGGRRMSTRRVRPGLRSSLFVPQDELLLDDAERLLQPFASTDALVAAAPPATTSGAATPEAASHRDETAAEDAAAAAQKESGLRARARSVTATLGGLFWPRRRRNTSPEPFHDAATTTTTTAAAANDAVLPTGDQTV